MTQDPSIAPTPTAQRPTLKTIAFMTGLGITTVSKALKDAPDIGKKTKERVQLVAKQIGYRPNRAGVRLRTGKTNVIALVLSTHEAVMGLTSHLVHGISEALADTQYHLVLTPYSFSGDPMEPVKYIIETAAADGIIFSRTEPDDDRVRYLEDCGFPFATHGRTEMGVDHPWHDFDNWRYTHEATIRLSHLGRQRLALLSCPPGLTYYNHLRGGFDAALAARGIVEIPLRGITTEDDLQVIQTRITELMVHDNRPDGIICCSGGATFGVVAGIEAAGLSLGVDVDVTSKQFSHVLPLFRSQLHVVNEDGRLAGFELARAVLGRIDGEPSTHLQSLSKPQWV